jgi:hypothetical protein
MDQHRMLVTLSALPFALVGFGALTIAVSSATSGSGNPIPWLVVGLAVVASAIGVTRGSRWAFVAEYITGAILVLGVAIVTLFSLAMASATSGGLDGNMAGTPFGVLSGWASLVLYAVAFAASIWMLAASRSGLRSTRS